jgi:hypothetical protein
MDSTFPATRNSRLKLLALIKRLAWLDFPVSSRIGRLGVRIGGKSAPNSTLVLETVRLFCEILANWVVVSQSLFSFI